MREPDYFPAGPRLFPRWPIWRPDWALALLAITLAILFLPKVLSAALVFLRPGGARAFGGATRFLLSVVLEFLASSLFAPIRMLFHTKFVLTNLVGRVVVWRSPPRGDHETTWREAIRHHGLDTLFATAWGAGIYWLNPQYFWWLTPIVGALVLSVPAVRAHEPRPVRRRRAPRRIVRHAGRGRRRRRSCSSSKPPSPRRNAAMQGSPHRSATASCGRSSTLTSTRSTFGSSASRVPRSPRSRERRLVLAERLLAEGPEALRDRDRKALLLDARRIEELHRQVWELPSMEQARPWGRPGSGP